MLRRQEVALLCLMRRHGRAIQEDPVPSLGWTKAADIKDAKLYGFEASPPCAKIQVRNPRRPHHCPLQNRPIGVSGILPRSI